MKELRDENHDEAHNHEDNHCVKKQARDKVNDAKGDKGLEKVLPVNAIAVWSVHYFIVGTLWRRIGPVVFLHSPIHETC